MKINLIRVLFILAMMQLPVDGIWAQPSPLHAEGKWLVNARDQKVSLHGVNIWSRRGTPTASTREDMLANISLLAEDAALGGANFFRLPIHSINICDEKAMRQHVDEYVSAAIAKAAELDLYILIEPHYFPGHDNQYVPCDDGQKENFATNPWWREKLKAFWNYTAPKFASQPHVIYGVTNEPVSPRDCQAMHDFMDELVSHIRPLAPDRLISVQSYAWTNNADCWVDAKYQMEVENILYEAHIYPWNPDNKAGNPQVWTERVGKAAEVVPVLIGEFGPERAEDESQWKKSLLDWMSSYPNMSWAAWCLDCNSSMELIDCERKVTEWGKEIGQWLQTSSTHQN